jgi:hypothetical protein
VNSCEEALYDALNVAGVNALVSGRIYRGAAPQGASHPLVIIAHMAGGDDNLTPGEAHNLVYQVRGVSAASADEAGDVAEACRAALKDASLTAGSLASYWVRPEREVRFVETAEQGLRYWHAGHLWRVRLTD